MEPERYGRILELLRGRQRLSVEDAAALLAVSAVTVRRDFRELAARGLVRRGRGAVLPLEQNRILSFTLREGQHSAAKAAIARRAAALLQPQDVVIVDGGTTTYHLSACLPEMPLRITTNSVRLAAALEERRQGRTWPEIHLTGGLLYPESGLLVGPATRRDLADIRAQWTMLSVGGITEQGIFNTHELIVDVERTMIEQGSTVVVLADRTKLGRPTMSRVCDLSAVDMLVTNATADDAPILADIEAAGVTVLQAM